MYLGRLCAFRRARERELGIGCLWSRYIPGTLRDRSCTRRTIFLLNTPFLRYRARDTPACALYRIRNRVEPLLHVLIEVRSNSTDEKRADWDPQGGDRLGLEVSRAKDRKLTQLIRPRSWTENRQFVSRASPAVPKRYPGISILWLAEPNSEPTFL